MKKVKVEVSELKIWKWKCPRCEENFASLEKPDTNTVFICEVCDSVQRYLKDASFVLELEDEPEKSVKNFFGAFPEDEMN